MKIAMDRSSKEAFGYYDDWWDEEDLGDINDFADTYDVIVKFRDNIDGESWYRFYCSISTFKLIAKQGYISDEVKGFTVTEPGFIPIDTFKL